MSGCRRSNDDIDAVIGRDDLFKRNGDLDAIEVNTRIEWRGFLQREQQFLQKNRALTVGGLWVEQVRDDARQAQFVGLEVIEHVEPARQLPVQFQFAPSRGGQPGRQAGKKLGRWHRGSRAGRRLSGLECRRRSGRFAWIRWQVRAKRNRFAVAVRGGIVIDGEQCSSNFLQYSGRLMHFDGLESERAARMSHAYRARVGEVDEETGCVLLALN